MILKEKIQEDKAIQRISYYLKMRIEHVGLPSFLLYDFEFCHNLLSAFGFGIAINDSVGADPEYLVLDDVFISVYRGDLQ